MKKTVAYEDNPKSIKFYVKRFLLQNRARIAGKKVVDFPAGNGVTSRIIKEVGGEPAAFDLFPEYFSQAGIECTRANIAEGIPVSDEEADFVICQEGIEHFSDQYRALKEFSRILKKGGSLIITTPNYSNLRSKLSYLTSESERFNSLMPPNEIDSIWMNDQSVTDEMYFGHIFLIGIQKLRVLARLNGLQIQAIHKTRAKSTSLLLFPFWYPWIWLSNTITYRKNIAKAGGAANAYRREIYREVYKLSIHSGLLVDGHLFVEFKKTASAQEVASSLRSVHQSFSATT